MKESKSKGAIGKVPASKADLLLAVIAAITVGGWCFHWVDGEFSLFREWFATLSFIGALALLVFVVLKRLKLVHLPEKIDEKMLPVLSLIPLCGYLVELITPIHRLLTVGGSIALAYVSATMYWRKQLLDLAGRRVVAEEGDQPAAAPED